MAAYIPVALEYNAIITKSALDHIEAGISAAAVATDVTAALNLKAPIANPTFTGTVSGITKAMVGLGNVDNTSDAAKPVSTATQNALNLKAPLESPAFTGTPTINGSPIGTGGGGSAVDAYTRAQTDNLLAAKATTQNPTFTGTVSGITTNMLPDFTNAVKNVIAANGGSGGGNSGGFDVVYNSTTGVITLAETAANTVSYDSSTGVIQLLSGYTDTSGSTPVTSASLVTENGAYVATENGDHVSTV